VSGLNKLSLSAFGWEIPAYFSMYNGFPHLLLLAVAVPVYLSLIFILKRTLKSDWRNNKFVLRYAVLHNSFMALFSLFLLVDCLEKMLTAGAFSSFTAHISYEGNVELFGPLYDLFFWSKYLELIDTLILCFKQKQLDFLHLFHHSTTASVGFVSRFQPLFLGIWTNSLVHVVMYIHFARPINSLRPAITTLQIVQFLWVLAVYFHWFIFLSTLSWVDVLYQNACYMVYLAFFLKFFYENYIASKPRPSDRKKKV